MTERLPVLVVGDVHGDLQRLFTALRPYPAAEWRTVFLGDLVDGGPFGVGALRYARDRPNSTVLLGNHEVAMLWALRDPERLPFWLGIGGQPHDLQELASDRDLVAWMRALPVLLELEDGTLLQHAGSDLYLTLVEPDEPEVVDAANSMSRLLLREGREDLLWEVLSGSDAFRRSRSRLDAWLARVGARRLVHGHLPHRRGEPDVYQNGLAICFDGGFSRYGGSRYRRRSPAGASVGPLPPLVHS
jgi:hypothetical protein